MTTPKTTVQELAEKWEKETPYNNPYTCEGNTRWWLRAIADVLKEKHMPYAANWLREEAGKINQPELLPCPFCGGEARVRGDKWRGFCAVCWSKECPAALGEQYDRDGCSSFYYETEASATAAWNSRALPQHRDEHKRGESGLGDPVATPPTL